MKEFNNYEQFICDEFLKIVTDGKMSKWCVDDILDVKVDYPFAAPPIISLSISTYDNDEEDINETYDPVVLLAEKLSELNDLNTIHENMIKNNNEHIKELMTQKRQSDEHIKELEKENYIFKFMSNTVYGCKAPNDESINKLNKRIEELEKENTRLKRKIMGIDRPDDPSIYKCCCTGSILYKH